MDPTGEIQSQSLLSKDILDPEKQGTNLNADKMWEGIKTSLKPSQDAEFIEAVSTIDSNPELRSRFVARQQNLLGLLGQEARNSGVNNPRFSDRDRAEITLMAFRIEGKGVRYINKVRSTMQHTFPNDPERSNLIADRMIQDYISSEYAIIQHLVHKMRQANLTDNDIQKKVDSILLDPRRDEWLQTGSHWEKGSAKIREEILKNISTKHPDSVSNVIRHDEQPNYTYLYLKPCDKEQKSLNQQEMKGVNDAQSHLVSEIQRINNQYPVRNIPTQQLKAVFSDLDIIGREVKVHIQPQVKDEPMVIDRLLSLLDKNPNLRDKIQAIKVRVDGNGNPEYDGNNLPEIVVYTSDKFRSELVSAIQSEFVDLKGNGLTPRFNQEVANRLIYVAQSGGDLKESLADMGVLDKFFRRSKNYSELRV